MGMAGSSTAMNLSLGNGPEIGPLIVSMMPIAGALHADLVQPASSQAPVMAEAPPAMRTSGAAARGR